MFWQALKKQTRTVFWTVRAILLNLFLPYLVRSEMKTSFRGREASVAAPFAGNMAAVLVPFELLEPGNVFVPFIIRRGVNCPVAPRAPHLKNP